VSARVRYRFAPNARGVYRVYKDGKLLVVIDGTVDPIDALVCALNNQNATVEA